MADEREFHQEVSGDTTGNVLQARDVDTINISNYYGPSLPEKIAEEIPPSVKRYINYRDRLDEIAGAAGPESRDDGPFVVEIAGAPRSGKSTIAYQYSRQHKAGFPGGRFRAELGPGVQLYPIVSRWLGYLGHSRDRLPPTLSGISDFWRSETANRTLLMLLDGACSEDIEYLLPGGPRSAVLVVPGPSAKLTEFRARHSITKVKLTPLTKEQALALLTHRLDEGQEEHGRVASEPEAAARLIEICGHSAGLLSIAAGMLADRQATITELVQRLERRGVTRHFRLTVIFDAAHDFLDEIAKRVYRAFGAHPGQGLSVSTDALAAALGIELYDVEDALDALLQASLIERSSGGRYLLTPFIADHATAKARDNGELQAVRDAFIAYYRDYGLRYAETLKPGRGWENDITPLGDHDSALSWLIDNQDAIAASIEAAAKAADHRSVVRLCLVTWPIYQRDGDAARMVELNKRGVAAGSALADENKADEKLLSIMLTQLAFGYRQQREWDLAITTLEWASTVGSPESRQSAIEGIGLVLRDQGKIPQARTVLEENLRQAKEIAAAYRLAEPDRITRPRRVAMARFHLATVIEPEVAIAELTSVREVFAAEPENLAKIGLWLGRKLIALGKRTAAVPVLDEAAKLADQANAPRELGLINLARADAEPENAKFHLRSALRLLEFGFDADADDVRARMAELDIPR
ncbi:MAG TPA: hypothetical protein VJ914_12440 [Pseudonocardiaceae bacterium]|nr:hypothetical protein [Pseudonocardiaceae bacterium]